ncbi:MAG TPA: FecR family protein [Puia sp.]|jgi:ferric-dicitrate binding protein FerR (iron transport regulator)|nr:FecR family protein [Puia sp.]
MSEKRIWELLVRQFNKEISEDELKELQLLLGERQDASAYPDLLAEMRALSFKPAPADQSRKENSLSAIQKAIRRGQEAEQPGVLPVQQLPEAADARQKNSSKRWLYAAAACTIVLIAGYFLFRESKRPAEGPGQFETIVTRTGSKTLITLPDSSTVVLNSACKFGYNKAFGAGRREMQLSGEAYFDIHKSPEMPLVIHAGNVLIRVLGTTFNVRANPEDSFVEATLIKGIIEVSLRSDPERKILLRPNEKIVIRRNEGLPEGKQVKALPKNKEEVIAVTKVEPDPIDSSYIETAWIRDKMLFHKEPFASLARKMERWYNVKILLSDPELNELVFTGSLEKETLQEAFRALQHSARFNYKIEGQTVTITKKQ